VTDIPNENRSRLQHLSKARAIALERKLIKRKKYLERLFLDNKHLSWLLENRHISKIVLVVLYMAEGSKRPKGSVVFGNSEPGIIGLFLHLFRFCYKIEEGKFRCTIQCRADQNITDLEHFWSSVTRIPSGQFLKAQVDKRSIGKPTRKEGYKGVCRIEYYSAHIFHDLLQASKVLLRAYSKEVLRAHGMGESGVRFPVGPHRGVV
jgi:hypothetical protein